MHRDYSALGAEIITVNSFATSPLMLGAAGLADRFEMINRASVQAALRAREMAGNANFLSPVQSHTWFLAAAGPCLRTRTGRRAKLSCASGWGRSPNFLWRNAATSFSWK